MKELPYFKFYPAQWITGNISFLSYEEQGAFMKLCCYYWSQECKLSKLQLQKIIPESYKTLLEFNLIKVDDDLNIIISWLYEQYKERKKQHKTNVKNGRKGGKISASIRANNKQGSSDALSGAQALRKDNIIKDKIKKDNTLFTDPNLKVDNELKNLLKK